MKKTIKILAGIVIVILAFLGINQILQYILVDDGEDSIRDKMHDFYEQENIDTLFLGSSHIQFGYNEILLKECIGENTYVMGSPVQRIDVSYHLLKDAIKKNDIKTVYLDMYYRQYRSVPSERTDLQMDYVYCVSDYMPFSLNKVELLLEASDSNRYIESFFPAARYGNYLFDYKRMERIVKSKRNDAYKNYEHTATIWVDGYEKEAGAPTMFDYVEEYSMSPIGDNIMSEYSLKLLDKTVKLCKDNDIELVLVATPMTNFWLESMGDYDIYHDFLTNYAHENNIEYYDFNYIKDDIFHQCDEYYIDDHHLSGSGATAFTEIFINMMTTMSDSQRNELFYSSIEEKLSDLEPQIFGIKMIPLTESEQTYNMCISSNYELDVEWRICRLDPDGNETELIQDWDTEAIYTNSFFDDQITKISARDASTGEIVFEEIIN